MLHVRESSERRTISAIVNNFPHRLFDLRVRDLVVRSRNVLLLTCLFYDGEVVNFNNFRGFILLIKVDERLVSL